MLLEVFLATFVVLQFISNVSEILIAVFGLLVSLGVNSQHGTLWNIVSRRACLKFISSLRNTVAAQFRFCTGFPAMRSIYRLHLVLGRIKGLT